MQLPRIKSYREFLETYKSGVGADAVSAQKRKKAGVEYARSKSTYGARAESLAEAGLSRSGYADYLADSAKGEHQTRLSEIALEERTLENEQLNSYASYLNEMRRIEDSAEGYVHRSLISSGTFDKESGMRLARIYGLSEEKARRVVDYAIGINIEEKRMDILDRIRTNRTSPERAEEIARIYNLPEEIVEEVKAFAAKLYGPNALWIDYYNNKANQKG